MVNFDEISVGEIGDNKEVVVSRRSDEQISIAQRVSAEAGGRPMTIYMKGAVTVDDEGFQSYLSTVVEAGVKLGLDVDSMVIAARDAAK